MLGCDVELRHRHNGAARCSHTRQAGARRAEEDDALFVPRAAAPIPGELAERLRGPSCDLDPFEPIGEPVDGKSDRPAVGRPEDAVDDALAA